MMIYDLNWQMELILRIMIASVLGYLIGFVIKAQACAHIPLWRWGLL